jgi:hypothetical protein
VDSSGSFQSVGGGTQYVEDAAAAADPTGNSIILVRKDTPSTTVSTDGDNIAARGTNYGAMYVTLLDTSGSAVSVGGGTQYTEDAVSTADPIGTMLMAVRRDTLSTSEVSADGDNIAAKATNKGELYVKHTDTIPVTQSGTWTVQPGNTANTTAWKVDGSAVTQPISGLVTANPGTAANWAIYVEDAAETAGGNLSMAGTVRRDSVASSAGTDGDNATLNTDASGRLWCNVNNTVTVASHAVTNGGTFVVQENGAALTSLQLIDDPVIADDSAFTPATSKVMMAGFEADESSTDSVDEGDAGAARMTLDRKQIVTVQPHTAGGATTFMASGSDGSSILVATKQTIKASAGQLYGYYAYNPEAAVTFVHFYNTDTVTVGTTNPQMTIAIPAGSAANLAIPVGISFSTAISCSATTTAGGNTAPATGVSLVAWYA